MKLRNSVKRILCLFLSCCMIVFLFPGIALAGGTETRFEEIIATNVQLGKSVSFSLKRYEDYYQEYMRFLSFVPKESGWYTFSFTGEHLSGCCMEGPYRGEDYAEIGWHRYVQMISEVGIHYYLAAGEKYYFVIYKYGHIYGESIGPISGTVSVNEASFPSISENGSALLEVANCLGESEYTPGGDGTETYNYLTFAPTTTGNYTIQFESDGLRLWYTVARDDVGNYIDTLSSDYEEGIFEYKFEGGRTYYIGCAAAPSGVATVSVFPLTDQLALVKTRPSDDGVVTDKTYTKLELIFSRGLDIFPAWENGSIYIKNYETDEIVREFNEKTFLEYGGYIPANVSNMLIIPRALEGLSSGRYYVEVDANVLVASKPNAEGKIEKFPGISGKNSLNFEIDFVTTLDALTEVDYFAFAALAYEKNMQVGQTVKEYLETGEKETEKKWNKEYKDGILYSELCSNIANWEVLMIKATDETGFNAVAFKNAYDEVVIAYRGSDDIFKLFTSNSWSDWVDNDFWMQLANECGPQFYEAVDFFYAIEEKSTKIAVTGHSLGGGWADVLSAYSGCKGVSFNAISILDVIYESAPYFMAINFKGIDKWNFADHINRYDYLAGAWEIMTDKRVKPYVPHDYETTLTDYDIATVLEIIADFRSNKVEGIITGAVTCVQIIAELGRNHGLATMIIKNEEEIGFGPIIDEQIFAPTTAVSLYADRGWVGFVIDFGTSKADEFHAIPTPKNAPKTSFGGDGDDEINGGRWDDTIIGGNGADRLDGLWGDDTYIYYKGDGEDYIFDISGKDTLYLIGYTEEDIENLEIEKEFTSTVIRCGGDIIRVYNQRSGGKFILNIDGRFQIEIQDIEYWTCIASYLISCPVNVEILDSSGNVVYIVEDGAVGSHYTEYGNFYVFEEEGGGYGKSIDLREGYTIRIVGVADGEMDIASWKVKDGKLADSYYAATDIAVTDALVATVEFKDLGGAAVRIMRDGGKESISMTKCKNQPDEPADKDEPEEEKPIWQTALLYGGITVVLLGIVAAVIVCMAKKKKRTQDKE